MKYKYLITLAACALPFLANAQSNSKLFDSIDINNNNVISVEEIEIGFTDTYFKLLVANLDKIDSNGEGQLSNEEFSIIANGKRAFVELKTNESADLEGIYRTIDINNDNTLSLLELKKLKGKRFKFLIQDFNRIDINGDKSLNHKELMGYLKTR